MNKPSTPRGLAVDASKKLLSINRYAYYYGDSAPAFGRRLKSEKRGGVMRKKSRQNVFVCPACGADMRTEGGALACAVCGQSETVCAAETDTVEFDFAAEEADAALRDWRAPVSVMRCEGCGYTVVAAGDGAASACPLCGGQRATAMDESPGIRPALMAPFKIDAGQAAARAAGWLKKRLLAPFSFSKNYTGAGILGEYAPYFAFDARVSAAYTGQAGDYYTDTELKTFTKDGLTLTKKRRARKLRWRFVSGNYEKSFADVIYGDAHHPKDIKKLEPFDLNELTAYTPRLLPGFAVQRAGRGLLASFELARAYMGDTVRSDIRAIVGRGARVTGAVNTCASFTGVAYRHMLLPVWIAPYTYKNRAYTVCVNGQTGAVSGKAPVSALKIGLILLGVLIAAGMLILIL